MNYQISIGEQNFDVDIGSISPDGTAQVQVNGASYDVRIDNYSGTAGQAAKQAAVPAPQISAPVLPKAYIPQVQIPHGGSGSVVRAPISGLIIDIKVKAGDQVKVGQTVATLEAMKMENKVIAASAGKVKEIHVQKGTDVSSGDLIMTIE